MFFSINAEYFEYFYYNLILLLVIITWIHTEIYSGYSKATLSFNKIFGLFLFFSIMLIMGFRPISWYFGDMGQYAKKYMDYVNGWEVERVHDIAFYILMKFLSYFHSPSFFFFTISFLYISSIYIVSKRLFKQYYYFAFLAIITSFEFWSYGTNGIRNGLATSIILLAFSYMNKKLIMYILFFIAFNIHSSVLIPIIAYFISFRYKQPKIYFYIWGFSIVFSYLIGSTVENIITNSGIMREDIVETYFKNKDLYASSFSHIGFRWDFLLYSSTAVIISYYFIFVKKIHDLFYYRLVAIFLLSNAAWILVIRASFSNRFAYLSWFMMGLVSIYPFLYPLMNKVDWKYKFSWVGRFILFYFTFTYVMKFVLPNI